MNREENRQDSVTLRPMGNNSPDPEADNLADEPAMKALSKMIRYFPLFVRLPAHNTTAAIVVISMCFICLQLLILHSSCRRV